MKSPQINMATVALAGNPNCGKTSLFNALTKLRQKVANYPGVTVEKKEGKLVWGAVSPAPGETAPDVNIIDLPGTYSLAVRSPDEQVARDVLLGLMPETPKPDLVICVVDASNLERNLYLVTQIQDLNVPVILVLNMSDVAERQGKKINVDQLAESMGTPVVKTIASKEIGIDDLKRALLNFKPQPVVRRWRLPEIMEKRVADFSRELVAFDPAFKPLAFLESLVLLSKDNLSLEPIVKSMPGALDKINAIRKELTEQNINWRSAAIEARYNWIHSILQGVVQDTGIRQLTLSDRIDQVLTHKVWGWIFFLGLMAVMFLTIFSFASIPMDWIDGAFSTLADWIKGKMPEGDLRDLLTDGVIAGVGGVVIFLPQILILFLFIGLLQDTGYMARAAFIMDRVMSKAGLHGKSFIPLLSSFACAIPGIMATRAIENPKDRLVTMLVAPWMSCSARLPVYTILIATLLPTATVWQKSGIMLAMYLLGIGGAFVGALVLKKSVLKSATPVFIMELPPYRLPSLKSILLQMWERSYLFLRKAGTVIFALSILLWALMTYPKTGVSDAHSALENSFAGMAGKVMEPVIRPLGYDWRVGIGLIGSFAAREVFVSTMNIVFNVDDSSEDTERLRDSFRQATWPDGRPLFTPLVCLSLMVFYVYAMQCVSTIAIVKRETNGWKWPLWQMVTMTGVAYVMALLIYQGGRLLGFH